LPDYVGAQGNEYMSDSEDIKSQSLPPTFKNESDSSSLKFIAIVAFGFILISAFVVVVIIPSLSDETDKEIQKSPENKIQQLAPLVDQGSPPFSLEAQEALKKVLKLQARLENEGVKIWGIEQLVTNYNEVLTLVAKANLSIDEKHFEEALKGYQKALLKLEQLDTGRLNRLERALKAGDDFFFKRNSKSAIVQYKIVLAIDSANAKAQVGLKRAENLPKVLSFITQGENYQRNGKLEQAREMFKKATLLDGKYQDAHDRLAKVDALIFDRDLAREMSDVVSALNQEKIEEAKRALAHVKKLRPDGAGIADLEQQFKNAAHLVNLKRLSIQGLKQEKNEAWVEAIDTYKSVLAMDVNVGFAQQGKLRAENALALTDRLLQYLSKPDALLSAEHMTYARSLYQLALKKNEIGPKFREYSKNLKDLIDKYSTLVPVVITSDGKTHITIYRVRKLGKSKKFSLNLRPGKFKVLGVRSGYRDIMRWIEVPAGTSKAVTLSIICKAKL